MKTEDVVSLIADDSWAMTFQSMAQYRSALILAVKSCARAQGAGEAVASSQDAEMLHGAHEVIRIWNERARKFGFDGVAGMLNAFRHGEAGSTTPTIPQATPPVQGDQPTPAGYVPEGFWLAPMNLDDEAEEAAQGQDDDFPLAGVRSWYAARDSWLARHPAAPQVAHPQPLAASEAEPAWMAAFDEARDAILHDRHALAEEGMTNDQTNAVLTILDDAFMPLLKRGGTTTSEGAK